MGDPATVEVRSRCPGTPLSLAPIIRCPRAPVTDRAGVPGLAWSALRRDGWWGRRGRQQLAAVAPLVVVAADVAHLDLPAGRVGRVVGEDAPLERLHQHRLHLAAGLQFGP